LVKWEKQSQYKANTNPIQTQYKPNSNPIYHGVASGGAGNEPKFKKAKMNATYFLTKSYEQLTMKNELIKQTQFKSLPAITVAGQLPKNPK
jgi:hypothetical protein